MKSKLTPLLLVIGALMTTAFVLHPGDNDMSQKFDFRNFNEVKVSSNFTVSIEQGETYSMEITGVSELFEGLEVSQDGQTIEIGYEKKRKNFGSNTLKVKIVMPALQSLDLSGAIKAKIEGFKNESLQIDISGASSCELNANINNVKVDISGAGNLDLKGKGDLMVINLSGASNVKAREYLVKRLNLNMSGAGAAQVYASEQLDVEVSGVGSVKYDGNPKVLNKKLSGMASIQPYTED